LQQSAKLLEGAEAASSPRSWCCRHLAGRMMMRGPAGGTLAAPWSVTLKHAVITRFRL